MDTHHHMVSVRVKSVLDSCDDDDGQEDEALMELQASQQVRATGHRHMTAHTVYSAKESTEGRAGGGRGFQIACSTEYMQRQVD